MRIINSKTRLYCIIGKPIEHTFSPYIHNAAFLDMDINAVYLAFEVEKLEEAVKGIRALGIRGASVTIPHKVNVIPYIDKISDIAKMIGSVNTIINENGVLYGDNTDSYGFHSALSEKTQIDGKNVAVLGSGGSARTIAFSLYHYNKPKSLYILARNAETLKELEENIKSHFTNANLKILPLTEWKNIKNGIDIIINTTPVGMTPRENESLLMAGDIPYGITVMDIVYNPNDTLLLSNAKLNNCNIVYGVDMLLYQGIRQFELWTKMSAPKKIMREALFEHIYNL